MTTNSPDPVSDYKRQLASLRAEIDEMAQIIHHAKVEIAAIKHPLADNDQIIGASSELDAIVDATENATGEILDAAEAIEQSVESLAPQNAGQVQLADVLSNMTSQLTRIMEACSFQDLTGQRITKVVRALGHIEDRISSIIDIWEPRCLADIPVDPRDSVDEDRALLSGPQSDKNRTSQEDIDALFD